MFSKYLLVCSSFLFLKAADLGLVMIDRETLAFISVEVYFSKGFQVFPLEVEEKRHNYI